MLLNPCLLREDRKNLVQYLSHHVDHLLQDSQVSCPRTCDQVLSRFEYLQLRYVDQSGYHLVGDFQYQRREWC